MPRTGQRQGARPESGAQGQKKDFPRGGVPGKPGLPFIYTLYPLQITQPFFGFHNEE